MKFEAKINHNSQIPYAIKYCGRLNNLLISFKFVKEKLRKLFLFLKVKNLSKNTLLYGYIFKKSPNDQEVCKNGTKNQFSIISNLF